MEATTLLAFAVASLLIELTPGPNMTYLAIVAASEGRSKGFAAVAGVMAGLAIIGFAAALGVSELVQSSVVAYEILRWAGVLFLLYLAWDGWRGGGEVETVEQVGHVTFFVRGLVTNLLNPKAAVFYVTVLPTFIDPSAPVLHQTFTLTAIYVVVATLVHAAIVALAGAFASGNTPERETAIRRILAVALALVALWLAWTTAR